MPMDFNPTGFYSGTADTVTIPDAPGTAGNGTPISVGGFADVLNTVTNSVTSVAKSIADLQILRDNIQTNSQAQTLKQYSNTAQMQLQRDQIAGSLALNKLGLQAQISKAQAAMSGELSGQGSNLMMILTVIGIGIAVFALVKK